MKRLAAVATGVCMSAILLAAAHAAQEGPKGQPGVKNSKKAMLAKSERLKQVRAAHKDGSALRKQASNNH